MSKEKKITAQIVQAPDTGAGEKESAYSTYILLKGGDYPDGTRLIPLQVDEFKAIYVLIFEMIKKGVEAEKAGE